MGDNSEYEKKVLAEMAEAGIIITDAAEQRAAATQRTPPPRSIVDSLLDGASTVVSTIIAGLKIAGIKPSDLIKGASAAGARWQAAVAIEQATQLSEALSNVMTARIDAEGEFADTLQMTAEGINTELCAVLKTLSYSRKLARKNAPKPPDSKLLAMIDMLAGAGGDAVEGIIAVAEQEELPDDVPPPKKKSDTLQ